jgi:hypothetical protein
MIGMIGFNKYLLVILFERRIDWIQGWSEDLDTDRPKLPGSPADQNNVEHQRKNEDLTNINEDNKISCVVIGGHPAGLMQSVLQLSQLIVCCELFDWFSTNTCWCRR